MRRHVTTLALTALATLAATAPAPPASAEQAERTSSSSSARKSCVLGVVGFDSQRHVRTATVKDGVVTETQLSTNALPFDVTAWGYYDSKGSAKKRTLQLNAVTADGTPHNVAIRQSPTKVKFKKSPAYDQASFRPRLFADGGLFYAYTVDGNTLKRYGLYRLRDGSRRFDEPVEVAKGFRDWTSLQAGAYRTVRGAITEYLYGTTAKGEMFRVAVPVEHPGQARVERLARSGYAGVTEMSWGRCGKDYRDDVLVAIDPVAGTATWTTVERPREDRPKAKLRGPVTGGLDWRFSAAF